MPLNTRAILAPILDHAAASGLFDSSQRHEPKRAPSVGTAFAMWVDKIDPIPSSGLDTTSMRLTVLGRVYGSMLAEPQDDIDPDLSDAVGALIGALVGDLELNGPDGTGPSVCRSIDVRGIHGVPLAAQAGYVEQDKALYRIYTITIPVLIDDVWSESR